MKTMLLIVSGLLGLCFDSFIHVVISRFSPNKTTKQFLYEITFLRSYCPHCQTQLNALSLIPVLSWLLQKGKCRYCACSIPIHYLLTELFIAFYCVCMMIFYGFSIWTIVLILLGLIFFVLAIIDIRYLLLPNSFTFSIMLMGLICAYFEISTIQFIDALIGVILGYILLWLPATFYYLIKKRVVLGGGDIKLLSALGTWIDYHQLPILLIIASSIGIIYYIFIYYKQSPKLQTTNIIPFGPCLPFAGYLLLLYSSFK